MSSKSPVVLILGSGKNIGQHVARSFAQKGYRVALASRSLNEEASTKDQLNVVADLSDPASVPDIFAKVKARFDHPSVVVYNAGAATFNPREDPFAVSLKDFTNEWHVNTASVWMAAQQAVRGFAQLPASASKTFIFTGNFLNLTILAPLMGSGSNKAATAHLMHYASVAYKDKGYKFYYADERRPDGFAAYVDISGEAAAEHYPKLAEDKEQGPWLQTFVKGQGYVDFKGSVGEEKKGGEKKLGDA